MNPIIQALFSPWEWRFEIVAVLLVFGVLYTVGWRRLRARRGSESRLATRWRLACYWSGLIVLAAMLLSPVDYLGGQLFFMHMFQHLLTMMVAAPLILFANPFPFLLWGLPSGARKAVAGQFRSGATTRRILAQVTKPAIAWMAFIAVYLGWHDPMLYNLALRRDWVHDLQHITFFAVAILYWWHVIGAGPKIHGHFPVWGKLAYLITAVPFNMFAGVTIAFSSTVIYTYYESIPRIWGLTTMQDQMLGGTIMWIPGSMMLLLAALIVLSRQFGREGNAPMHVENWDSDEALAAPGLEHRAVQNRWKKLEESKREAT